MYRHCSIMEAKADSLELRSANRKRSSSCHEGSAICDVELRLGEMTCFKLRTLRLVCCHLRQRRRQTLFYSYNMGRVLLKVRTNIFTSLLHRAYLVSGYHSRRQWVRDFLPCTWHTMLIPIQQRRQDIAHEPVCQQAIQQSIQGHYWRRLVRFPLCPYRRCPLFSSQSLTKEVMVDDRLVTMQVYTIWANSRATSSDTFTPPVMGHCGTRALPVPWSGFLPWSRLLCTSIRRQQRQIL